jgi:hypothetical protein
MAFLGQLIPAMEPEIFVTWSVIVGAGLVVCVVYFVLRRRQCAMRGHDFIEVDAMPTVTVFRCRRCGVQKHE